MPRRTRAKRVRDELGRREQSVTEAIYDAGFNSNGRFYEAVGRDAGHDADRTIARAARTPRSVSPIGECSLGLDPGRAGASAACAPSSWATIRRRLLHDLQDRFPQAELIGGDEDFEQLVAQGGRLCRGARRSGSICRSMCAARRSSSGSGRRCARSRPARPRAMPRSRSGSARRKRCARWRRPAPPIAHRGRDPLPSRGAQRRRVVRLSLGRRAQARAARARGSARERARRTVRRRDDVDDRVAALDWATRRRRSSNATGAAVLERLLTPKECRALAALYDSDAQVPQPRRDGAARLRAGRVQVFLPIRCPTLVAELAHGALSASRADRQSLERARWASTSRYPRRRTPSSSRAATRRGRRGRRRCCCSTDRATTTACIRISTASIVFPLQVAILLSRAGRGFHRRRVRADRAAAAHAVAAPRWSRCARRRGGVRGASSAGAGHARDVPREPAPRREPLALGSPPYAGRDLPRREIERASARKLIGALLLRAGEMEIDRQAARRPKEAPHRDIRRRCRAMPQTINPAETIAPNMRSARCDDNRNGPHVQRT